MLKKTNTLKIFFIILTLSLILPLTKAFSRDMAGEFISNYDGDTMTVKILTPNDPLYGTSEPVRLKGIDTPEIRGNCIEEIRLAEKARIRLNQLCYNKPVLLKYVCRDKYNRLLADVFCGGLDVTAILLREHLGVAYSGHTQRIDWCGYLKKY